MLTRRTVMQVILEDVYGTDPAAAGTMCMQAWDVDLDIRGERLDRAVMRDTISPMPHVIGMQDIGVTFKAEVKSSGPGCIPEMDWLLDACAFATAAHTGTAPIIYSLVSDEDNMRSVTLFVYKDGNKHKVCGCRGTVRFVLEPGKYGIAEFEFNGLYLDVAAAALPGVDAAHAEVPPIIHSADFQLGSIKPVCNRAQIDLANVVVKRASIASTTGVESFRISGRAPKMEVDVDAVVESSNPYWADWTGEVVDTYSLIVGSNAGHGYEIQFTGYFQWDSIKYGDADGVSQYECVASLCSSDINSSNDELKITFGKAAVA